MNTLNLRDHSVRTIEMKLETKLNKQFKNLP